MFPAPPSPVIIPNTNSSNHVFHKLLLLPLMTSLYDNFGEEDIQIISQGKFISQRHQFMQGHHIPMVQDSGTKHLESQETDGSFYSNKLTPSSGVGVMSTCQINYYPLLKNYIHKLNQRHTLHLQSSMEDPYAAMDPILDYPLVELQKLASIFTVWPLPADANTPEHSVDSLSHSHSSTPHNSIQESQSDMTRRTPSPPYVLPFKPSTPTHFYFPLDDTQNMPIFFQGRDRFPERRRRLHPPISIAPPQRYEVFPGLFTMDRFHALWNKAPRHLDDCFIEKITYEPYFSGIPYRVTFNPKGWREQKVCRGDVLIFRGFDTTDTKYIITWELHPHIVPGFAYVQVNAFDEHQYCVTPSNDDWPAFGILVPTNLCGVTPAPINPAIFNLNQNANRTLPTVPNPIPTIEPELRHVSSNNTLFNQFFSFNNDPCIPIRSLSTCSLVAPPVQEPHARQDACILEHSTSGYPKTIPRLRSFRDLFKGSKKEGK
jgi:hypothetical protein